MKEENSEVSDVLNAKTITVGKQGLIEGRSSIGHYSGSSYSWDKGCPRQSKAVAGEASY